MQYKKEGNYLIIRLDRNDEICSSLEEICREERIQAGMIQGLGAIDEAVIGVFDPVEKIFLPRTVTGYLEVASLTGNVSRKDRDVYLHIHAVLGDEKGNTYAGHLTRAVIRATGEIFVRILNTTAGRRFDPEIGLNLLDL